MKSVSHEKRVIQAMVQIYCTSLHHQKDPCEDCSTLLRYAEKRIERCKFGIEKPACKNCPVHCYSPEMRQKIREVMRYSGPRMIYKHPVMALYHLWE